MKGINKPKYFTINLEMVIDSVIRFFIMQSDSHSESKPLKYKKIRFCKRERHNTTVCVSNIIALGFNFGFLLLLLAKTDTETKEKK